MGTVTVLDVSQSKELSLLQSYNSQIEDGNRKSNEGKLQMLSAMWYVATTELWRADPELNTQEDWLGDLEMRCGVKAAIRTNFYRFIENMKTTLPLVGGDVDRALRLCSEHGSAIRALVSNGAVDVVKDGRGVSATVTSEPTDKIPELKDNPGKYLSDLSGMTSGNESLKHVLQDTGGKGGVWVSGADKVSQIPDFEQAPQCIVLEVRHKKGDNETPYNAVLIVERDMPVVAREELVRKLGGRAKFFEW